MRVLVCGSRDWTARDLLNHCLDMTAKRVHIEAVIEGEARGADLMARDWAEDRGIAVAPYPADWAALGKRAGSFRNHQMLNFGKPDLVVAFPWGVSRGTRHMIGLARKAGIPVWIMPADCPCDYVLPTAAAITSLHQQSQVSISSHFEHE